MWNSRTLALVATFVLVSSSAFAADPPPVAEPATHPEKRAMPDYDARPEIADDGRYVALWTPRMAFLSAYLFADGILRRPVGAFVTLAEKKRWPRTIIEFFTWSEGKSGIVPTGLFDFGFRPSIGAYYWSDEVLAKENGVRVYAATGGARWLTVSLTDRFKLHDGGSAALHAEWTHRPDWVFYGMGPRSREENRARYASTLFDVGPRYEVRFWRSSSFRAFVGYRSESFEDDACCDNPTILAESRTGAFAVPPGYLDGYAIGYHAMELAIDTRHGDPATRPEDPPPPIVGRSGVRAFARGEEDYDLRARPGRRWVRYAGALSGFWDVDGHHRVLGATVFASFADPLDGDEIPFTQQVSLGGSEPMRGYLVGRLVDRSAVVASLDYTWPVWVFADGALNVSFGNVFGEHLRDFDPKLLRLSAGAGLRTNSSPDHAFEVLVGFGTETFESGLQVTSFRLFFGGVRGF